MTTEPEWLPAVLAGVTCFIATAVAVPFARRLGTRLGVVDVPAPGKSHARVTPYLGGAAIAAVVLTQSLLLPGWSGRTLVLWLCALAVVVIGLVDDVRTASPWARLAVEVCAATAVCAFGRGAQFFHGPGDVVLTVAWVVLLTNSFNLLDNLDACAGLVGFVTAAALAIAAGLSGQAFLAGLAAAVAGACGGFLLSNWHPARIFMGDAGALFLGFVLAILALEIHFPSRHGDAVAPVLIAGVALFDTTLVVVSRSLAGVSILTRGTDHTSHRLVRLGVPIRLVGVSLGTATAALCVLGVAIGRGALPAALALVPLFAGTLLLPPLLRVKA